MTGVKRPKTRPPLDLTRTRIWDVVEGAVVDAVKSHPDYFTDRGRDLVVGSITKRVVGQLAAVLNEVRKDGGGNSAN